jgi:hypothetical protein
MVMAMTMYLPTGDMRATGEEPAEFIEPPTFAPAADPSPASSVVDHDDDRA